ncbi:MAG: chromosome segregation protein SMC [Rhizobiales bacterium]|nr:chromosome segregation protein SMC [Hyphomicrobiales bacterium]
MKFSRLRLSGFKSFVEPTELVIESGLTGVVGPNGCGKSNLLEALRWVMGENSYKNMRASGMDDVIFSGTTQRPARNMAEVMLTLANDDRDAPPQFNDSEALEVSRRIEREAGSAYRINGRDVRARDVQLLFADASTGARSPALVRQGQIAEIINAKPQARRLILEEAAGITGLHTRRHEAELKLKAAEQNVARLDDVIAQLESQVSSLRRQARQAQKYRLVSAEIRKLEAAGLYVAWRDATETARRETEALDQSTRVLAELTRAASQALRERDELGDKLPVLREQETIRAAVLQRLNVEQAALDEEEKRAQARTHELSARLRQIEGDLSREQDGLGDIAAAEARLAEEHATLSDAEMQDASVRADAARALQAAAEALANAQESADAAAAKLSELTAQRNALERQIAERRQSLARISREGEEIAARRQTLLAALDTAEDGAILTASVEHAAQVAGETEAAANAAEAAVRTLRQTEGECRQTYDEARRNAERLQTEVRTLTGLLKVAAGDLWPAMVDAIKVRSGYETALGAALGEDIDASGDEAAPVHWRGLPPLAEMHALPEGATSLLEYVEAPSALTRCLSQAGVVARGVGPALQAQLQPGQILVSIEGDMWRWDGFTSAADAPSASARRLAERNRLAGLEVDMQAAMAIAEDSRRVFEAARSEAEGAVKRERETRDSWRAAIAALDVARRALAQHERQVAERAAQTSALDEASRRVAQNLEEARAASAASEAQFAELPALDGLNDALRQLREMVNRERGSYGEARAHHDGLERAAAMRSERLRAIDAERKQWRERETRATQQVAALSARVAETRTALEDLALLPERFAEKRARLLTLLQQAERERRSAADDLQTAENAVRAADTALRAAQDRQSSAREDHARAEARLEAARQRHEHCERRIAETLQCEPTTIVATLGLAEEEIPPQDEIEQKLTKLREDRERLGAVNLRAEEEAEEVAQQLDGLKRERDDLIQAITKLRAGITSLNREGRQRLLDAFETVNVKFGELFTRLFGGGKAELQLVESDDPLEAGLEILAHPPGKKPTVLSLLSGGEQTLTALSLIFAVFLTNPSPICVLDEVDAPLDDHNVERFCNLLDAMLERTETRFLIITHHPLTMARMHRLYGVTMMERGVSQLVSVDLQQAEALREAS